MIALILNYLRRSWLLGIPACIASFAFQLIASRVFLQIHGSGGPSLFTSAMPKWVQSAFNIGPTSMTELNGFMSVCWQHPFLLTVLLALPVALITGWLTGDIEKRSIALVLCRPVGRFQVISAAGLVVILWGILTIASALAGSVAGAQWIQMADDVNQAGLMQVAMNLAALVFAFMGIAAAVSSLLSVRGDAVGWCLTIVLVMYVWNFLAEIWYSGGGSANYSLFRFYHPTQILMHNQSANSDILTLLIIGGVMWFLAGITFRLRSFSV